LYKSISFNKTCIRKKQKRLIRHNFFNYTPQNGSLWPKKENDGMFDVTMGNFDGAEVCELVGLFILNDLVSKYGTKSDSSRTTNSPFLRTPKDLKQKRYGNK